MITVAGQDIPNLKVGALRDAMAICERWPALRKMVKGFNRTERVYEFTNGSPGCSSRVNEIRLKVLEGQVAVLQTEVAQLKKH